MLQQQAKAQAPDGVHRADCLPHASTQVGILAALACHRAASSDALCCADPLCHDHRCWRIQQLLVLEVLPCELPCSHLHVLLMPSAVPSSSGPEAMLSLIGAIAEACYMPCFRGRLVPGHCLIVPAEHVASTRQVDEHVWTEIRNFKKCLLQMFMAQVRPYYPQYVAH